MDIEAPQGEAVDLGLSVYWADRNVGANSIDDIGGKYMWGEVKTKEYSSDYKWNIDIDSGFHRCMDIGLDISGTPYDVAHVKWGDGWRMPTVSEMDELIQKCTWQWISQVGGLDASSFEGVLITGPNGNSIYFPAEEDALGLGWSAEYFTSTIYDDRHIVVEGDSPLAFAIYISDRIDFSSEYLGAIVSSTTFRIFDSFIRPVKDKTPENPNNIVFESVDLGLSVEWASCNVGATKPEEYGGYYAWGETEEKDDYSWSTYKWCNGNHTSFTKYCLDSNYGDVDNKYSLEPLDDVAHMLWENNWRMPTIDEVHELMEKCSWMWTSINDVTGQKVTGPNGNSIFFPAAGYKLGSEVTDCSSGGRYWSSTLDKSLYRTDGNAYILGFGNTNINANAYRRDRGHSIRAVRNK